MNMESIHHGPGQLSRGTPASPGLILRLGLAILLTAFLLACAENGEEEDAERPDGTPVRVTEVEVTAVDDTERSIGTVETFSSPVVAAEVAGRIQKVEADVGDDVSEGDLLARIEREPFELARNVAAAEAARLEFQVSRLESDLRRLERLSEREYATEQDKDSVAAELAATREQLTSARNQRSQAERDLRLTDIVSPMAGVVDQRMISEGGFINAGEPAFRVQPRDRFRAVVSFSERAGDRLERGMAVTLKPRGGRSGEVTGELTRLRPAVDSSSRSVRAIVDFDNPGNWRPGMTVEASVVVERRQDAIRVPSMSVVQRPDGHKVFRVKDDEVEQVAVELGVRTRDWVEIREGLSAGDTVVTDGANFLSDGARIRVREDD